MIDSLSLSLGLSLSLSLGLSLTSPTPPEPGDNDEKLARFARELSKISPSQLIYILGHPLHPRGKISTVQNGPGLESRAGRGLVPASALDFFSDFATFSAGFLGFFKVFARFTHSLQTFCEGVFQHGVWFF